MVYQPPTGARDLLPLDVAQKRWIEERLQQAFHQWGYHRIITSTLERLDTLMAGGAIQRSTVLQLQGLDEEELGLRPELTASIARTVVTRMAEATYPLRLYYNANIFRRAQETSHTRQQEFYQAGVELLGSGGLLADAETLLLLMDCLQSLGLDQWSIVLGEAGLTRSLLSVFPATIQATVRQAIATLDRLALETLPMSQELRDRALLLLDLRGTPAEVFQKISSLDLNSTQQTALDNLKSLIDLLQNISHSPLATRHSLVLDLSLIQTLDYYTGIVFEVVSDTPNGRQVLGQGGRYDQLLGLYHPQGETAPGIGFALQIEQLYQAIALTNQIPQHISTSDWLVVPANPQAYTAAIAHAQQLRTTSDTVRVELDLGGRTPAEIHDYAQHRRIAAIAWISPDGTTKIERMTK
ncbi:ATP phosphoribosyltransferase regulatory subunit [Leptolyngbyaceae cyanobacterium UHCC 1019]